MDLWNSIFHWEQTEHIFIINKYPMIRAEVWCHCHFDWRRNNFLCWSPGKTATSCEMTNSRHDVSHQPLWQIHTQGEVVGAQLRGGGADTALSWRGAALLITFHQSVISRSFLAKLKCLTLWLMEDLLCRESSLSRHSILLDHNVNWILKFYSKPEWKCILFCILR